MKPRSANKTTVAIVSKLSINTTLLLNPVNILHTKKYKSVIKNKTKKESKNKLYFNKALYIFGYLPGFIYFILEALSLLNDRKVMFVLVYLRINDK